MDYTLEQIEWLHDNGWMPDWAYYQQNRKNAYQNYAEQRQPMEDEPIEVIIKSEVRTR